MEEKEYLEQEHIQKEEWLKPTLQRLSVISTFGGNDGNDENDDNSSGPGSLSNL